MMKRFDFISDEWDRWPCPFVHRPVSALAAVMVLEWIHRSLWSLNITSWEKMGVVKGKAVWVYYEVHKRLICVRYFLTRTLFWELWVKCLFLQDVELFLQWKFRPSVGELEWMSRPQKTSMVTSLFSAADDTKVMGLIEENQLDQSSRSPFGLIVIDSRHLKLDRHFALFFIFMSMKTQFHTNIYNTPLLKYIF